MIAEISREQNTQKIPEAFRSENKKIDFSGYSVLLIEDAASMRAVEKALLKEMGFINIMEAATNKLAHQALENKKYDIILCDWELPDGDGLELLQSVRAQDKEKKTPFLMVTSNHQIEKVKEAIVAGVTDFIAKPFEQQKFCGRIQKALLRSGN